MIAEPGKTYARVVNNVIVEVWDETTMKEWHDNLSYIEVPNGTVVGQIVLNDSSVAPDPGPRPSEFHDLDLDTGLWVLDPNEDQRKEDEANNVLDNDKKLRTLFELLFIMYNDIRVLNSQPTVTRAWLRQQLVDYYKSTF